MATIGVKESTARLMQAVIGDWSVIVGTTQLSVKPLLWLKLFTCGWGIKLCFN